MMRFRGLSAFPLTPTTASGEVMTGALEQQVEKLAEAGVDSICVLGSSGIYPYLSRAQRREAVAAAVRAAGRVPVMAGVGALRTDEACHLARDAVNAGASALLLAPISYLPLTADEVYDHFEAVAAETSVPICVYDNPTTTGFAFDHALLGRLAALPTVQAVKLPLGESDAVARDIDFLGRQAKLSVGYGFDIGGARALMQGADAWYSITGGFFPALSTLLARAAAQGDEDETSRIEGLFAPLWNLFLLYGSIRVIYAAACLRGHFQAQPPLPIRPLAREVWPELGAAIAPLS